MTKPQDIIDLIDVGLQTPAPDPTYGEVSPTNQETCARCHRPPADESDWCEGCRAFLLGDGEDPREERRPGSRPTYIEEVLGPLGVDVPTPEIVRELWADSLDHICGDTRCVNPDHLELVLVRHPLGPLYGSVERWRPCTTCPPSESAMPHPSAHYRHVHG